VASLSPTDAAALSALLNTKLQVHYWDKANWIGWCPRGHLIVTAGTWRMRCSEPVALLNGQETLCREEYRPMPEQDALLAAFKLGGWTAVMDAARAMIASADGG
jgi:hypothetical protein